VPIVDVEDGCIAVEKRFVVVGRVVALCVFVDIIDCWNE